MRINEMFAGGPKAPVNNDQPHKMYVEDDAPRLVVTYPGRFQPFHLGHRSVFSALQGAYGRDHVFIVTSNKTEQPKSPFSFSDKLAFFTASGVPADRIIESQSPYKLPSQFDYEDTILVIAVGAPDADRLRAGGYTEDGRPTYYQKFESVDKCQTADKHAYVLIAQERKVPITLGGKQYDASHGTECRELWNSIRKNAKQRGEFLMQLFGRNDPELGRIMDKIDPDINEAFGEVALPVDTISPIHGGTVKESTEPSDEELFGKEAHPLIRVKELLDRFKSVYIQLDGKRYPIFSIYVDERVPKRHSDSVTYLDNWKHIDLDIKPHEWTLIPFPSVENAFILKNINVNENTEPTDSDIFGDDYEVIRDGQAWTDKVTLKRRMRDIVRRDFLKDYRSPEGNIAIYLRDDNNRVIGAFYAPPNAGDEGKIGTFLKYGSEKNIEEYIAKDPHCPFKNLEELRIIQPDKKIDVYFQPKEFENTGKGRRVVAKGIPGKTFDLLAKGMYQKFGITADQLVIEPSSKEDYEIVEEDAAGVGVVSNSKDPRYVMATAGDQNDVTAETLPREMRAYGLIGRKTPHLGRDRRK